MIEAENQLVKTIDPKKLNYSQRTINKNFTTPDGPKFIWKAYKEGPGQVNSFPPVDVIDVKGQLVVRNGNSRLSIAQETGAKEIKYIDRTDNLDQVRDLKGRLHNNRLDSQGTDNLPGTIWKPLGIPYDIDLNLYSFHEWLTDEFFAKFCKKDKK